MKWSEVHCLWAQWMSEHLSPQHKTGLPPYTTDPSFGNPWTRTLWWMASSRLGYPFRYRNHKIPRSHPRKNCDWHPHWFLQTLPMSSHHHKKPERSFHSNSFFHQFLWYWQCSDKTKAYGFPPYRILWCCIPHWMSTAPSIQDILHTVGRWAKYPTLAKHMGFHQQSRDKSFVLTPPLFLRRRLHFHP